MKDAILITIIGLLIVAICVLCRTGEPPKMAIAASAPCWFDKHLPRKPIWA